MSTDTAFFPVSLTPPLFLKGPLFTLYYPGWARLSDIVQYRFYREPTDKPGRDEDAVYFDNERIYIKKL